MINLGWPGQCQVPQELVVGNPVLGLVSQESLQPVTLIFTAVVTPFSYIHTLQASSYLTHEGEIIERGGREGD